MFLWSGSLPLEGRAGEGVESPDRLPSGRAESLDTQLASTEEMPESLFGLGWSVARLAGEVALFAVAIHAAH